MLDTFQPVNIRSLRETAELAGVSLKTLRNLIDRGAGPVVTASQNAASACAMIIAKLGLIAAQRHRRPWCRWATF